MEEDVVCRSERHHGYAHICNIQGGGEEDGWITMEVGALGIHGGFVRSDRENDGILQS